MLVPLLGMQYILTPFKPKPGHSWEIVYEIVSAFTTSFQVGRYLVKSGKENDDCDGRVLLKIPSHTFTIRTNLFRNFSHVSNNTHTQPNQYICE